MSRIFIVSGESSGDKLGALLSSEFIAEGHDISGWGGRAMRLSGVSIVQDISALKIMGWTDVLKRLPTITTLFSKCKKDIIEFQPAVVILIDFGSFNLRLAKWAKRKGYQVIYYSPPKIWASRPKRINALKKYVDQVIVLFPFEKDYYESQGLHVSYFGHPLANEINNHQRDINFKDNHNLDDKPIIAILPGSRKAEISSTLPIYLTAANQLPSHQICISSAPGMRDLVDSIATATSNKPVIIGEGYFDLLMHANLAIVTSGTANLETALFGVPQVVGYRTSWLNYTIAKVIIKSRFISLTNLVLDKEVVTELIQAELTVKGLLENLIRLSDTKSKSTFAIEYDALSKILTVENSVKVTASAISDRLI